MQGEGFSHNFTYFRCIENGKKEVVKTQSSHQKTLLALYVSSNHEYVTFVHFTRILPTFLNKILYELALSCLSGEDGEWCGT